MTEPINAGWYRDPFGRHERRYHTGTGWTEHVKTRGQVGIDPPHAQLTEVPAPRPEPVAQRAPAPAPKREPEPTRPPAPAQPPVKAAPAVRAPAAARTPKPAGAAPIRAGLPAASRAAVAVALPPVKKRAASSYLRPAPRMTPAAPVPTHRVRWPWVVGIILVLVLFTIASGIGFIEGTATEPTVTPPPPQRAPHTISDVQYDFVPINTTRARVIAGLGRRPADRSEYRRVFTSATTDPACAYYYGNVTRRSYMFCFNASDRLATKTIRSLPAAVPAPKPQAKAKG